MRPASGGCIRSYAEAVTTSSTSRVESPDEQGPAGPADPTRTETPPASRRRAALSGVLSVGVSLGLSELAAAVLPGARSLVLSIGDVVIDSVPGWLERAAIATLGIADKPVLVVSVLVVAGVLGGLLGIAGSRRFRTAVLGFAVAAALGAAAAMTDPRGSALAAVAVGVGGAVAGVVALRILLDAARTTTPGPVGAAAGLQRRTFVRAAVGAAVVAGSTAFAGRMLALRAEVESIRGAIRIPRPARPAPPAPLDASVDVLGVTPLYVPNAEFYRIDTALTIPQVDPVGWSMEVSGLVDRPLRLTYDELLAMPHIEADVTLSCVSNPVGGDLVGNARWQGVRLRDLLERAGVQEGATQVLGRSVDGFTAGFPTTVALATDDAMVAVAMNGEPLPARHGFPARLVVPGLFGYVSATKWLSSIELTSFSDVDGYWIPRGWAKEGPVVTQSRIDVPRPSAPLAPGSQPVAGVAWAPTRGIERVEVRIDDGPWVEAELGAALSVDTWRQWVHYWDATPGRHVLAVRATDGTGDTQTPVRTDVAPSGATGHHTIEVTVE